MLLRSVSLSRSQQPIMTSLTELRSKNPSSSVTEAQSVCCTVYLPTKPADTTSSGLAVSEKSAEAVPPSWAVFNGLQGGFSHTKVPQARSTRANTKAVLVVPPSQSQCTNVVPWCNTWWYQVFVLFVPLQISSKYRIIRLKETREEHGKNFFVYYLDVTRWLRQLEKEEIVAWSNIQACQKIGDRSMKFYNQALKRSFDMVQKYIIQYATYLVSQ